MAKTTAVAKAKINLPVNISQQLAAEAAAIANKIGTPGGDRIKVTQKKTFRMPSGEENAGPIQAVIVDFVSANFYYEGAFDPNDITPPLCAAIGAEPGSLAPFNDSPAKQCDTCAACPQNQFGSAGRGKACQNSRLLALLPLDATEDTPLMLLKVSPTALRSFDGYVASIARSFSAPPIGVVTEISFDDNLDYPSLRFGNPTPNPILPLSLARREEAQSRLNAKPEFTAQEKPVKTPAKKTAARGRR
jgi:hypothetical protein